MQVNVAGIWTEVPDDTPIAVPFDESRTVNPLAIGDNRGCPPGYFCEYLPGWSGEVIKTCRRFDAEIGTGNNAVLAAETGPGLLDATIINVASASAAVVSAMTPAFTWVLLGLGALALLFGVGKGRSHA